MTTLWDYFWPVFAAAMICGAFAMWWAYRLARARRPRRHRRQTLAAGFAVALALGLLWHGPLGAADRLRADIERTARTTLDYYEMRKIRAELRRPLARRLLLSGPADDFQRKELVRILNDVPGVGSVGWRPPQQPAPRGLTIPLVAEAGLTALVGFAVGLLVAFLVELRRRNNADWRW